ncbi:hypothetical protein ACIF8T_22295 [Streptomyces sp. NPDC085946]|uniref:hypothetical protein n=1 Tax=Streptomyces sp. NPDC085946 TaxID=3365744 RepID=UPI0037D0D2A5
MGQQTAQDGRGTGTCKACGSRPADPAGGAARLCAHCAAVLVLPDASGLVEDEGAVVRRMFENRDRRAER